MRAFTLPALLVAFPLVAQESKPIEAKTLSLQEAIQIALENNLQVGIAETTRDAQKANVLIEGGSFDWTLNSTLDFRKSESFRTNQFVPGGPITQVNSETKSRSLNVGVTKPFEWGGTLNLNYGTQGNPLLYSSTDQSVNGSPFVNITPFPYTGAFNASYSQSLLRNFGREAASSRVIVARNGAKIADLNFQKAIIDLVASVESAYWDVVYAKQNLENKNQSLALAQKQLKENRIRVEVGTLAPIEVTSAEAAVAQREQDIISAEAQYFNAKDTLSRALFPLNERTPIEPSEAPKVAPVTQDEEAAEKMALLNRVELKAARLEAESRKVSERAANNRTLPQLDLSVGYTSSAGTRDSFSQVNSDITGSKFPGYNVTLNFSLPILNKGARGAQAQARANRRQGELNLRDQELAILLETRQALRNLQASEKGVTAAEKTRIFQEKTLEAEQKKFENGMSTNFFVLQRQTDLDNARAAELQARIGYAKAVTALEKALGHLPEARNLRF